MELVREIHRYPWLNIAGTVCLAAPVITALYFHPDWHGPRANVSIAIWLDATLRMTATMLSLYRLIVTSRGGHPVERVFQTVALMVPSFLSGSSTVGLDPELGRTVVQVLLTDRRGVLWSTGIIVLTLGFITVGQLRRSDTRG